MEFSKEDLKYIAWGLSFIYNGEACLTDEDKNKIIDLFKRIKSIQVEV